MGFIFLDKYNLPGFIIIFCQYGGRDCIFLDKYNWPGFQVVSMYDIKPLTASPDYIRFLFFSTLNTTF